MKSAINSPSRRAFTLVELMVAIALVLVLMLGVSKVFSTASQTISANQGISDHTRDARAVQAVFADDFSHMVTSDSPLMILRSSVQPAFRNRADDLADAHVVTFKSTATAGHILTVDIDGNNVEGDVNVLGERVSASAYNTRNHRTDVFAFFARGLFHRQTGNDGTYVANQTTSEAWIKYGHLRLFKNDPTLSYSTTANYNDPGAGTFSPASDPTYNPNNYYATQWLLGRNQILLTGGTTQNAQGYAATVDLNGVNQHFINRKTGSAATSLAPLSAGSSAEDASGVLIQESRYDLAGITIAQMRLLLTNYLTNLANGVTGYLPSWYSSFTYPMWCNPYIRKPITSQDVARNSPIMMPGCTQFIVEYAGDYLRQNTDPTSAAYGDVLETYRNTVTNTTLQTDGQIDFVVIPAVGATPARKQIRWYGLPRDVDGDGVATGGNLTGTNTRAKVLASPDVMPLRDLWQLVTREANSAAPFEKPTAVGGQVGITHKANYADVTGTGVNGMGINDVYTCAWGPNDPKPRMIRITLVLDDPSARTADGQTFEYVFELP